MNLASRLSALVFTALVLLSLPSLARADRVVLYPVGGSAPDHRIEEIEERLGSVIRALGHEVLAAPGGLSGGERPSTAAQMSGVATAAGATYVVAADVTPMRGQYQLHIMVGYTIAERMEELVVVVVEAEEEARLRDVLAAMLRPQGLGDDAMRLTGVEDPDAAAQREAEEAARREEEERQRAEAEAARAAEEEAARRAEEERAAEEARRAEEERAAHERDAWERRPQYASDGLWAIIAGVEGGYAVGLSPRTVMVGTEQRTIGGGGGIGLVQLRVGRAIEGTNGLELRAGADIVFGALNGGLDVVVGATYQFSPFVEPIYIGAIVDLGLSFAFGGPRDVGFVVRAGAVATWRATEHFYLELALPELGVVTNGSGAFVLGAALRAQYRF